MIPLRTTLALLAAALPCASQAQQPRLNSHEVNRDGSVTFRYYAPTATEVKLNLDFDAKHRIPFSKGADGVWTVTTAPLQPAEHIYAFISDGVTVLDPLNSSVENNIAYPANCVVVRGDKPMPWDENGAPEGVVHHHAYKSAIIQNLPDGIEDFFVYTPPGYDPAGKASYPVLYLLHGWSSPAGGWIDDGQANLIFNNLIAEGRMKPMVVVMPLGYGDYDFVTKGLNLKLLDKNLELFSKALLGEIIPQVESAYRVERDPGSRAIAGLSMGGGESLVIGLNHPELFGWIGGFSSAVVYDSYASVFPSAYPAKDRPRLLWVSCGTEDDLIGYNRKFVGWLKEHGLEAMAVETPGIHNWPVWRDNLVHFAPLLFRAPAP